MTEILEYEDTETNDLMAANEDESAETSPIEKEGKLEKNRKIFQGILSTRIIKSRWQHSLHGLNIFNNLVNKGKKMENKQSFNSASNIAVLAKYAYPLQGEEIFVDNQIDLFTYYSYLTKKISRMNAELTSKNNPLQLKKDSFEIIFIGCLTSHISMIFVKFKESVQNNLFNPITYREIFKLFGESSDKFTKSLVHENISLSVLKNTNNRRVCIKEKLYLFQPKCKALIHKECEQNLKQGCRIFVPKTNKNKFFGVSLERILTVDYQIPLKLSQLLKQIELRGIHYEGIYRKSGATAKIKEIYDKLNNIDDSDLTFLENSPIHALSNLVKNFFRDLPNPVIGEELAIDIVNYAQLNPVPRSIAFWNILSSFSISNKTILNVLAHHLAKYLKID
ncbi:LOW QUALITY PROTEIN: hypothetical protein MXB_3712 [Myxobolus squamalis]|nr:LOW QUALITY PROTEIN: hypothetical protein MXB_3712 [Myxobolus squamalis]